MLEIGQMTYLRIKPAHSACECEMLVEVIPAADHFQIDVEVIGSLPASGQWLIEIPGR